MRLGPAQPGHDSPQLHLGSRITFQRPVIEAFLPEWPDARMLGYLSHGVRALRWTCRSRLSSSSPHLLP
eukprot:6193405-Pleurochrysis_carterae.AAC.6